MPCACEFQQLLFNSDLLSFVFSIFIFFWVLCYTLNGCTSLSLQKSIVLMIYVLFSTAANWVIHVNTFHFFELEYTFLSIITNFKKNVVRIKYYQLSKALLRVN